ncbi:arginyltransferase [Sandaracinus amylolyticus]|uniref:Arginine-tRNA-protein transferase n=1 Tax=Sandaracinus amylolyticus TaxID=927083 RepID=A0A0F6W7V9_9BACT|nr:arginyltransferase [Sandaracinus amylolyticus]AKF09737.1 Arginine-tRNA-protein transferase [Sandaracinus amylolyticus]
MTRVLPTIPPELVVVDEDEPCPYLEGHTARRPLRVPIRPLSPEELDARLEAGDRRSGPFLYNQRCPSCSACEPLRIDVRSFEPSSSQRRAGRKGDRELIVEIGEPLVDEERVALFGKHEELRGLRQRERALDTQEYARFLVESSAPAFEIRYRLASTKQLVGIAITDRGARSLSAVYTYYDPDFARLSPGVYSILTQLRLCQQMSLRWLYLGLAIEQSAHMRYKLAWYPHERRIGGVWTRFEEGAALDGTPALR